MSVGGAATGTTAAPWCLPKIRFGNIGGEVHRELAVR
jgi:hypothetical protein